MLLNCKPPNFSQLKEGDLWTLLSELIQSQPKDFPRIKWIPSHCDENQKKAANMIKAGLITQDEIHGNAQADLLAREGAKQYAIPLNIQTLIKYKQKITMMVQNMIVAIWTQ